MYFNLSLGRGTVPAHSHPSQSRFPASSTHTWSKWHFWQLQITSFPVRFCFWMLSNQRKLCLACQEIEIRGRQYKICQESRGKKKSSPFAENMAKLWSSFLGLEFVVWVVGFVWFGVILVGWFWIFFFFSLQDANPVYNRQEAPRNAG